MEAMHMLQQNLYNENGRYIRWIFRNFRRVFSFFDFIPIIFFLMIYVIEDKHILDLVLIASMFVYLFGIVNEYRINKDNQNKLPLKATGRIKRLFITLLVIYGISIYITVIAQNDFLTGRMLILLALLLGFIYFVVYFANVIDTPLNKLEYYYYLTKSKKKLK